MFQKQALAASSRRERLLLETGIQKLEEGSVNVTIGTLERLSRGFGVDVRRLFDP